MEQAELRPEREHKASQDFEWQGQRWQLVTFLWKKQRRYRCPHCEYDHYIPATVLKHLALEHVHTVYRLGQQFDLHVFFRGGARIYKCPDCAFEAERSAAVAEHCSTTHRRLAPSRSGSVLEPIAEGSGNAAKSSSPNHESQSLSPKELKVFGIVGEENFKTLTNAEIMKDPTLRRRLSAECQLKRGDAAKSCLDRIRRNKDYPLSRQIRKKRSSTS